MDDSETMRYIRLSDHPFARNQATASQPIHPGQVIFATLPLTTALLPSTEGQRCDNCHCLANDRVALLKCSGCASFWYCGVNCQITHWKAHHRRICKAYNRYTISSGYQALPVNEKVDAMLLSQLLVQVFPKDDFSLPPLAGNDPLVTSKSADVPQHIARECFSRFGNNNFVLHSHLNTFAHGVYPLASRLFNHSCIPNCVVKYRITRGEPVKMEIVSLHEIAAGEEITIPYLDPALPYETRQNALQANYGFRCACLLCTFEKRIHPIPSLPQNTEEFAALTKQLQTFTEDEDETQDVPLMLSMPAQLYPLLNESYLPELSEQFSHSSHEGEYETALLTGRNLLALYKVLYHRNFPQIGMHALELAKTAWNAVVTAGPDTPPSQLQRFEEQAISSLTTARRVLQNYGPEGDEGGPLEEILVLQELLEEGRKP
ncbi:unnamed protein product [Somion occarium]|uniref:SET domain-containing protein n=1 Tax=Somion occarium TaxID=3059160 RepID=A0ABP1E1R5_9APHY